MPKDHERDLMLRVWNLAGPHIRAFSKFTSVPDAFWGSLTSLETGAWLRKNTIVPHRFEPHVQDYLIAIKLGTKREYGGITAKHLFNATETDIKKYASSWGLTQVLGYHCLRWGVPVERLEQPELHYQLAARLLAEFCEHFDLDQRMDHEQLLRAWNTGSPSKRKLPDGREVETTHDPEYVNNGLRRMELWREMEDSYVKQKNQEEKART